jgi:hypothetical protein
MANSIHVQLADAIAAELNSASRTWQLPAALFQADRTWKPWYTTTQQIEELQAGPKVAVVPLTLENEWLARNKHKWNYGVGIDVQKMFDLADAGTPAAIDLLDSVCQDIQDWFNDGHELTGMAGYISLKADREEVYNLALLHADNLWETLIMVGVRGHR